MKMSTLTIILVFSHLASTSEAVAAPKAPTKPAWNLKQGQKFDVSFFKYSYPAGRDSKKAERANRVQEWTVESIDSSGVVKIKVTPKEEWVPGYRLQLHPSGKFVLPQNHKSPDWFPMEFILKDCIIPLPTISVQGDGTLVFGVKQPETGTVTEYKFEKPYIDLPDVYRFRMVRNKNGRYSNLYTHQVEYDTKTGLPKMFSYRLIRTKQGSDPRHSHSRSEGLVIDLRYSISIRLVVPPAKK